MTNTKILSTACGISQESDEVQRERTEATLPLEELTKLQP
jgi:hypothetical protein